MPVKPLINHGVNGIPGAPKGKGKQYTKEYYDKINQHQLQWNKQIDWNSPQGQAKYARIAANLGIDNPPAIARPVYDIDVPAPRVAAVVQNNVSPEITTPVTPVRRVVADDYDLNLDFVPDPPNPWIGHDDVDINLDFDPTPTPVNQGSYDYDLLDANSGPAYNPMTGYGEPTARVEQAPLPLGNEQLEIPFYSVEYDPSVTMPQFNRTVDKGNLWDNLKYGATKGFNWGIGDKGHYSKSILDVRAPQAEYNYLTSEAQLAFAAGRLGADVIGHGTRSKLWNLHPEDFTNTEARRKLTRDGASRVAQIVGPYAASVALGIGSGNYNPLNFTEGGRTAGFAAVQADRDDPTQSTTPVSEILIDRGMFGRKGRLLPWEQFKAERPDVSFEDYEKYKEYLLNKDDNLLRSLTLGIAKGTLGGINGPELNVMGYSVTPLGAAAALGTLAAVGRMGKVR